MINRRALTLLLSLTLANTDLVEAATLSGKVVDYLSLKGIGGVEITVYNQSGQKIAQGGTDADGAFFLSRLPDLQSVRVEFDKVEYVKRPTYRNLTLGKSKPLEISLLLQGTAADQIADRFLDRLKEGGAPDAERLQLEEFGLPEEQVRMVLARIEEQTTGEWRDQVAQVPTTDPRDVVASLDDQPWQEGDQTGYESDADDLAATGSSLPLLALIGLVSLGTGIILWRVRRR